jgi:hypothetical protein
MPAKTVELAGRTLRISPYHGQNKMEKHPKKTADPLKQKPSSTTQRPKIGHSQDPQRRNTSDVSARNASALSTRVAQSKPQKLNERPGANKAVRKDGRNKRLPNE